MPVGNAAKACGPEKVDRDLYPAAERAASAYYEARREKAGISAPPASKAFRNDRRWRDFMRIASVCSDEGWDPADYVARGVELLGNNAVFMVPSDLLVDNVKASYRKAAAASGTTGPEEDLEFADDVLKSMAGDDPAARDRALMSPFTPFPAWYRAVRGSERTLTAWSNAAMSEMRRSSLLAEWLRGEFPEAVSRLTMASGFSSVNSKWEDSND